MDDKDLPTSSDESDADFVPKEEESESGSEESDYGSSDGEKDKTDKSRKRKKKGRKSNKKQKVEKEEAKEGRKAEEKNVDVDALWADFKKDVSSSTTRKTAESYSKNDIEAKESDSFVSQNNSETKPDVKKPVRGFPRNRGGLSNVLNQIGKKDKMSTLQKSQLDWNNFKKSAGIEEEIKLYNRGKDGYLEKQDFLQRTDLRQFEIEKDLRNTSRRKF